MGFEKTFDHKEVMIDDWLTTFSDHYQISVDNKQSYTGLRSLKILNNSIEESPFFSKSIDLNVESSYRFQISCFIKLSEVSNSSGLFCKVLDQNGKQLWYTNTEMQSYNLRNSSDWQEISISVLLDKSAKKIIFGGYLSGNGSAWFDDFKLITKFEFSSNFRPDVEQYTKDFLTTVRSNSLYSNLIDWDIVDRDIHALMSTAHSLEEAQFLIDYVLQKLRSVGDAHSFVQSSKQVVDYTSSATVLYPELKMLDKDIGYIYVPRFSARSPETKIRFAKQIQNFIIKMDSEVNVKGWIVDLRKNTGGDMYPMIAGLGLLLGNGKLGNFVTKQEGKIYETSWSYTKGRVNNGKNVLIAVNTSYILRSFKQKIAVLVGPLTSSSGEMVAISFKNKNNVSIMGQPTGGYTTGNTVFNLANGGKLYLATSYITDNTGRPYMGKLQPDMIIDSNANSSEHDINNAISWILK